MHNAIDLEIFLSYLHKITNQNLNMMEFSYMELWSFKVVKLNVWKPGFVKSIHNEPYPKLRHKQKNGRLRWGTLVIFVWATIGQKYLNNHISAKDEDIEL